jgi:hypothetical protein
MGDEAVWFTDEFGTSPSTPDNTTQRRSSSNETSSGLGIEGIIDDSTIQGRIAREVYGRGREKAQGFVSFYANIDIVRPYFDVDPKEVAYR